MIKWEGEVNGRATVGIGLSSEDIHRIKNGWPLIINGTELGLTHNILIHFGNDTQSMVQDLVDGGVLDKNTKVKTHTDEPRPRPKERH